MKQHSVLVIKELQLGDYKTSNSIVKHIKSFIDHSPLITISPVLPEDMGHYSVVVMSLEAFDLMKDNDALNIFHYEFGGIIMRGFDNDDNLIWERISYDVPDRFISDKLRAKEYGLYLREFIRMNSPCTFIQLGKVIADELHLPINGRFNFMLVENSISWSNMSRIFNEIIWESLDYNSITFNIATAEMYQDQGRVLNLPVAKSLYKAKVLKWLPLMFYKEEEKNTP